MAMVVAPLLLSVGIASGAQASSAAATVSLTPQSGGSISYGAFAYAPPDYSSVAVAGGTSAVNAEVAAIHKCGQPDCIPVAGFEDAYGTFDVGAGAWGWGYAATSQAADQNALSHCRSHGGGSACHPVIRAVTANPSTHNNGSDLTGRACMVFAPLGADIIDGVLGPYGHVGWAFLTDRDSGTWIFGANEGPSKGAGGPSETWIDKGNWSKLVNDFSSAVDYHKAGYYLFLRCSSFAGNNSLLAYNKALSLWRETYSFFSNNDCLTNAVDILRVYGATLEASDSWPYGHWAPKDYYYNELTGWEPSGYL